MGIAGDKPRQLAPTVGTTGSGSTDSPAPSPTTTKTGIDTIIAIAAPTSIDTTPKINVDTIAGIAVPAIVNANPEKPEVDVVDSIVVNNVSPSTAKLAPAANVIDPTSGTTGTVPGGYDMAFGLFNFHVDNNGAIELLSIGEWAPLVADTTTSPAIGGKPSTSALLAPSEEEPKLKTSTPSVGLNDFKDSPPSPTTAYCPDCDAYHHVGAGDFSSHEIAGCEDPREGTAAVYPTISECDRALNASRSAPHRMTLTTSKGYIRTTHVQMTTTTSTPKLRGKLAIQQAPPHIADRPHPAMAMQQITILTS
jgi:hypothetical protein